MKTIRGVAESAVIMWLPWRHPESFPGIFSKLDGVGLTAKQTLLKAV